MFEEIPTSVRWVYLNIVVVTAASIATNGVYVVYFQQLGWVTADNIQFYALLNFLSPLMVIVLNPFFGYWQSHGFCFPSSSSSSSLSPSSPSQINQDHEHEQDHEQDHEHRAQRKGKQQFRSLVPQTTKGIFLFDIVLTSFGYLTMALVNQNKWVFLFGYLLSRISLAQGGTRLTFIISSTPYHIRTTALSLSPVSALLGALCGPIFALICTLVPYQTVQDLLINPSTATFYVAAFLSLARLPFLIWGFQPEAAPVRQSDADGSEHEESEDGDESEQFDADGHDGKEEKGEEEANDDDDAEEKGVWEVLASSWRWLLFFSLVIFLFQLSNGVYTLTFQPILVGTWGFGLRGISIVLISIVLLSILPPTMMAILSRRCGIQDRWFLLAAVVGILLPMLLFAWPSQRLITVLVGGSLAVPFSTLIFSSCNALFSKKQRRKEPSGVQVGILSSSSALGTAIGSLLGDVAQSTYGSFYFLLWVIPLVVALVLVLISFHSLRINPAAVHQQLSTPSSTTPLLRDHLSIRQPSLNSTLPLLDKTFPVGQPIDLLSS